MIGAIDHIFDKLIEIFTPPVPPDDMEYCPHCGGTGYGALWTPCQHCGMTGYISKKRF